MINIEKITEADIDEIVRLTVTYLTSGEEIEDDIRLSVHEGNYYGYKAVRDGEIVGFMTFKRGIGFTTPHPSIERDIRRAALGRVVWLADGLWVSPEVRGQGVGSELARRIAAGAADAGCEMLLIEEWIYPDGRSPVKPLAAQWGDAVYEKSVPLFYKDLEKYGMTCPICGRECKCSADIVLYDLTGDKNG